MDKNLIAFIEERNRVAHLMQKFGSEACKVYDVNKLSVADRVELLDRLECELSPENLCCDGELRGKALDAKTRMLVNAKKALEGIA